MKHQIAMAVLGLMLSLFCTACRNYQGLPTVPGSSPTATATASISPTWHVLGNAGFSSSSMDKYAGSAMDISGGITFSSSTGSLVSGAMTLVSLCVQGTTSPDMIDVMNLNNGTWSHVGSDDFPSPTNLTTMPSLANSNGEIIMNYLALNSNGGGTWTFTDYTSPSWQVPTQPTIAIAQPYVITVGTATYAEAGGATGPATVYEYTNFNGFQPVGSQSAFTNGVGRLFTDGNTLYATAGGNIMAFNGTSWSVAATALLPGAGYAENYQASNGKFYALAGNSLQAWEYNSGTWQQLGNLTNMNNSGCMWDLSVDSTGVPYVAGTDSSVTSGNNLSVARYVSGAWQYLGNQHFANGGIINLQVFHNQPYALFSDANYGGKATMMTYY